MSDSNGEDKEHNCLFSGDWDLTAEEVLNTVEKINETHSLLTTLVEHTSHLPNIADTNQEIKKYLMGAATGKDHVPLSVVERLVKMGGWIVFGLMTVIVFLLTGSRFGIFPGLH